MAVLREGKYVFTDDGKPALSEIITLEGSPEAWWNDIMLFLLDNTKDDSELEPQLGLSQV